jgi:hypothetical protein
MNRASIKENIAEFRKIVSDKHRKPIFKIFHELLTYWIRNKDYPEYYSKNMVHRKDVTNYLDYYLGKKEFSKIRSLTRDKQLSPFFENKVLFHHHFKSSPIRLPHYLGYNIERNFLSPAGNQIIHDLKSFSGLIEELFASTRSASIFIKPIDGVGGRDCFKIDAATINTEYLAKAYDKISSSKYLFEETLAPHPLISEIYPYSMNTLRIHTCVFRNGKIGLVSTYMRFGSRGGFVEGGGLGTIFVGVDMVSGKLMSHARKNFEYGGDIYTHHPDTGYRFEGFSVPHIEAALETAKSAVTFLPHRLIGWDIAITEEGPVLFEGNINFGFWGAQIEDGGYKKNKMFKSFFEELTGESK